MAEKMIRFFAELTESFVDAYLITLLTIDVINGKPMFLSVRKLIQELHTSIKDLFNEGILPHQHSCLKDVIRTSFRRFENMGFIVMKQFINKKGAKTTFIQSLSEKSAEIHEMVDLLQCVRKPSPERDQAINTEIMYAI